MVVAVLDTGITSHSDLNANVIAGYDFVSDATAARDGNGRDSNPGRPGRLVQRGRVRPDQRLELELARHARRRHGGGA